MAFLSQGMQLLLLASTHAWGFELGHAGIEEIAKFFICYTIKLGSFLVLELIGVVSLITVLCICILHHQHCQKCLYKE